MGSGIALVAAQGGFVTTLFDVNVTMLDKAATAIKANLDYLINKQKISTDEAAVVFCRINFVSNIQQCKADLLIEAIVENAAAKIELFNKLAMVNDANTIFASNTSSLSISTIQASISHPERVVGMHFFNPAQVMKLVEVVKGEQTADTVAQKVFDLCKLLNKMPVLCKDAPGFIVNRVARHYYLEAMKIVEQGIATIENVDAIMEATGFKMGPFKLMDLIGLDINLSVSQSLYQAFNNEERFKPAAMQLDKVAKGELGKKSGNGFYEYMQQ
jgi:3-hydroxybutyryl-CoA dehydrogenase